MTARAAMLALLAALFTVAPIAAQENAGSKNMTLFGWINPVTNEGEHSACWGYAAPDGREYGILGTQIGTSIVDITTAPVRQVAFIPGPRSSWREMKTYSHYLYIITESPDSGSGMQIVDLADLPQRAVLLRTDTTWFVRAHTVFINDHYLYANGTDPQYGANGGIVILDLEPDPVHPVRVGIIDRYYYHDSYERGDTLVGAALGKGFDIYDVRDRSRPAHLANVSYPYSGTHNAEITTDGGYIVTSDEIGYTAKTMKVWDIHDLQNIRLVAEYTPAPADIIHNVHVAGRYVVASWYTAGVRIIDMIDPVHPREVGYYDTWPGPSGGYNGVWDVFAHMPSGKIVAGDRHTGLYVFEFNGAVAASITGVVRDARTGQPLSDVEIAVAENGTTIRTGGDGRYYVGGAGGDSVTLRVSLFGYGGLTVGARLAGDIERDIELEPLQMMQVRLRAVDTAGAVLSGFSAAVEPFISSRRADGDEIDFLLPRDSMFTITVGLWGYRIDSVTTRVTESGQIVTARLERRYHDDATLDLGWSYQAPGDDAVTGRWTRIVPFLGFVGADWAQPPAQPDGRRGYVFMTGAPALNSPPEINDVNGGVTTLTSPTMDLRDHPDPVVSYDLWFVRYPARTDTLAIDTFFVDITNDGGETWHRAEALVRGAPGWSTRRFYPREILPTTGMMQVRFRARDLADPTLVLAAIDNFDVGRTRDDAGAREAAVERHTWITLWKNVVTRGDALHVTLERAARVELFDLLGRRLYSSAATLARGMHDVMTPSTISTGRYMVRAVNSNGDVASEAIEVR